MKSTYTQKKSVLKLVRECIGPRSVIYELIVLVSRHGVTQFIICYVYFFCVVFCFFLFFGVFPFYTDAVECFIRI